MTKTTFVAFLAAVLLGSSCVVVNQHAQPGDITFVWTFEGQTCSQAGVRWVQVTIPGESLENGGLYPCSSVAADGIVLHSFAGGTYSYTLEGENNAGAVLYQASGNVTVNGDKIVNVDLMPAGGPASYALLGWTFPANWTNTPGHPNPNPNCSDATASVVDVQIDGGAWTRYTCADGFHTNGVASIFVESGSHTVRLVAVYVNGANEYDIAEATGTLTTVAYSPAYYEFPLAWTIGGTSVDWVLYNGTSPTTCASAGVTTVYVNFWDIANGNYVYGGAGEPYDCTGSNGPPIVFWYLRRGTYKVYTSATSTTTGWQYLSPDNGPTVTITAGLFPPASPAQVTLNTAH